MKAKKHAVYTFTVFYVALHTGVATRFLIHDCFSTATFRFTSQSGSTDINIGDGKHC